MKNVIYSKYSNDRADKFKIRTDIVEDLENRFVRKKALTQEANTHINDIYENYKLLSEAYKGSKICINKCHRIDDGVEFEYIEGSTLEEELDELLKKKRYNELVNKIQEYVSTIETGIGTGKFKKTKDFIKIFGDVNLPSSLRAGDINDIDLVFSNIIVGRKWNIIDYEWSFNFSIPFNFIIYRALHYYMYGSAKRHEVINLGLYKLMGITDDEIVQYDIMERNFQSYVLGTLIPTRDLYTTIAEMNINVQNVIERERKNSYKKTMQVFYDYGNGFTESQSYKFIPEIDSNNKVKIEIPLASNTKQIRIDPSNYVCIVNIDSILGYNENYYSLDAITNGLSLSEKFILFSTDDPQIVLSDIKLNTSRIEVQLEVQMISKEIVVRLYSLLQEKEDQLKHEYYKIEGLTKEVEEIHELKEQISIMEEQLRNKEEQLKNKEEQLKNKEEQLKNKEEQLKNKEQYINEIHASKGWKALCMTKKLLGR
ncbi:hypothetical protein [Clostridium beijerinckii]|uniref:Uncharacterized protein n=3 Tax=Clostridium beijerinckii TaxID=1520 RepID=A0AAE2RNE6_CLOBE|nr:hypothetical protein [Clostridium beijerinckii]ABR36855.1 hypothetical protein Cbei_4748 [Clostridium beijerinckii NCIMB 8052]AIU01340.1 hypothetical protein Cbs_4748 [Clostridium beijerinckii ATCC 35702]MBF7808498.1 hypothetical protein [Clostridium beijerinckii]NRT22068.1 hypothetical protein [Clostridium beijerinckii]NRT65424.1 hypothetical protein [Clostridium beijerinckii]